MPIGLHDLLEEALPLLAEDLRAAREGLGITSTEAAERAELDPALYRALEEGVADSTADNVRVLVSAAERLGLEAMRISYFDEVEQYMKGDLSKDGPLTTFVDTLRLEVGELKEQAVFVSPRHVMAVVERIGFFKTLASRQLADKQLIELWIAAVFTLCLDRGQDYYVRLVNDDPPDAEVLGMDGAARQKSRIKVEISQHGRYSKGLVDVIEKKLRKKYQEGTVIVVLVERAESVPVADLDDFIRKNNPHDQRVVIIGGSETAGRFKVVPWQEVIEPTSGEPALLEMDVDAERASMGHRGYEGVVLPPLWTRFLPSFPVFVKKLELHRSME